MEKEEEKVEIKKEVTKTDAKKQTIKEKIKKAKEETIQIDEKKEKIIYWLIGLIVVLLIVALIFSIPKPYKQSLTENNTVVEIINGNTFKYYNATSDKIVTVRLLCVDISGKNNKTAKEEKGYLRSLILYKEVTLKSSAKNKDFSGRLLRYVYVKDYGNVLFVNKMVINNGYGKLKISSSQNCTEMR